MKKTLFKGYARSVEIDGETIANAVNVEITICKKVMNSHGYKWFEHRDIGGDYILSDYNNIIAVISDSGWKIGNDKYTDEQCVEDCERRVFEELATRKVNGFYWE